MINTKLACEYEKQIKLNFPKSKTIIHEIGNNVFLDFTMDVYDKLEEKEYPNTWFYISYESKEYKNDILVTIGMNDYEGTLNFLESHKVFEMNINNLKYAVEQLAVERSDFYYMKQKVPNKFNDELNYVIDEDLDISIDWAKKHGVCYKGSVKELKQISKNDFWDSVNDKEELKYAIALMRAVYKNCSHASKDDDFITVNSYGLKHRFENFMDKLKNHKYFSTGTATVAAWYVFVGDGSYDSNTFNLTKNGPNYDFRLPKQAAWYFNDLMNK